MHEAESRTLSRRLLLAAVRPDPRAFHDMLDRVSDSADWDWMLDRATAHKVVALLAFRVDQSSATMRLPAHTQARLEEVRQQARDRAEAAQRTLQQLACVLSVKSVPFLVVKGSVLAELVYGDPCMRPFYDVDIVVPQDHLAPAEEAICSLGYRFVSTTPQTLRWYGYGNRHSNGNGDGLRSDGQMDDVVPDETARAFFRRFHQHFAFQPSDSRLLPIELHWRIARPWLCRLDPSVLWNYTSTSLIADTAVSILTPDALLLHAATHAMNDSVFAFRLLPLVDIAWILAKFREHYEPERVWTLAGEWGVRGDLACALQALQDVIGGDGTRAFASCCYQGPLRRAVFRMVGSPRALVDQDWPAGGIGRLSFGLLSETLWEIATRRPPRNAARTAAAAMRTAWHTCIGPSHRRGL